MAAGLQGTNAPYSTIATTATKTSWLGEKLAPGSDTVNVGSTSVSVVSVAMTASAEPAPSLLNRGSE